MPTEQVMQPIRTAEEPSGYRASFIAKRQPKRLREFNKATGLNLVLCNQPSWRGAKYVIVERTACCSVVPCNFFCTAHACMEEFDRLLAHGEEALAEQIRGKIERLGEASTDPTEFVKFYDPIATALRFQSMANALPLAAVWGGVVVLLLGEYVIRVGKCTLCVDGRLRRLSHGWKAIGSDHYVLMLSSLSQIAVGYIYRVEILDEGKVSWGYSVCGMGSSDACRDADEAMRCVEQALGLPPLETH